MPSITDKITKTTDGSRPLATTVTATRAPGVTTLSAAALTGWETATTAVHFATFSTDANGAVVAGTQCDWKGIVSGSNITNLTLMAGTDNGNTVGDIISPTITAAWGDELAQALLLEHKPTGAHDDITATSINVTTSVTLPNGAVDGNELSTSAITLGYAQITADFSSSSTSDADVTGLSTTVTVPAGGRRIEIYVFVPYIQSGGGGTATEIAIKEGTTTLSRTRVNNPAGASNSISHPCYSAIPSAGSHTYKVTIKNDSAVSASIKADATYPAYILVKAI